MDLCNNYNKPSSALIFFLILQIVSDGFTTFTFKVLVFPVFEKDLLHFFLLCYSTASDVIYNWIS